MRDEATLKTFFKNGLGKIAKLGLGEKDSSIATSALALSVLVEVFIDIRGVLMGMDESLRNISDSTESVIR